MYPTEEEKPQKEFRHLTIGYELGYVAFSDSNNNVYTFHLDTYFQFHPAFIPSDYPRKPISPTLYRVLATKTGDSDEDESEEEGDEEEEEEVEEEEQVTKNFSHWFEVCKIFVHFLFVYLF
jgi:hypothetical protein